MDLKKNIQAIIQIREYKYKFKIWTFSFQKIQERIIILNIIKLNIAIEIEWLKSSLLLWMSDYLIIFTKFDVE